MPPASSVCLPWPGRSSSSSGFFVLLAPTRQLTFIPRSRSPGVRRSARQGHVMPAVFGDFLAAAAEHLEAAVVVGDGQVTQLPEVAWELHQLVAVMSHYLDDLAPYDEIEVSGRTDLHAWERVVIDADAALHAAADHLHQVAEQFVVMRTRRHRGGRAIWPVPRRSWRRAGTCCTRTLRPGWTG